MVEFKAFTPVSNLNFIEIVVCTTEKKKRQEGKKNSTSNWNRKQDDVPSDIQLK